MSFKLHMGDDLIDPHIRVSCREMKLLITLDDLTRFRIHENFCMINGANGDFYISWTEHMITIALEKNKIGSIHLSFPHERSDEDVRHNIQEVFAEAKKLMPQDPPKYAVPAASPSPTPCDAWTSPIDD